MAPERSRPVERSELESTVNRLVAKWAPLILPGWDTTVTFTTAADLAERMKIPDGVFSAMSYSNEGEMVQNILINTEIDWDDFRTNLERTVLHELVHAVVSRVDVVASNMVEYLQDYHPWDSARTVLAQEWKDGLEELCDRISTLVLHVERGLK